MTPLGRCAQLRSPATRRAPPLCSIRRLAARICVICPPPRPIFCEFCSSRVVSDGEMPAGRLPGVPLLNKVKLRFPTRSITHPSCGPKSPQVPHEAPETRRLAPQAQLGPDSTSLLDERIVKRNLALLSWKNKPGSRATLSRSEVTVELQYSWRRVPGWPLRGVFAKAGGFLSGGVFRGCIQIPPYFQTTPRKQGKYPDFTQPRGRALPLQRADTPRELRSPKPRHHTAQGA